MASFCTNCGVSLPNDIKFCTDCGNKIEQDISVEDKSKESEEIKEVEKFENKPDTTQETPESPVNTFCRGDESLEELLKMVSLQKEQKAKLGVLQLITAIIKPSRPDTYNQFIQKLSEIEPELFIDTNEVDQKSKTNVKKETNEQTTSTESNPILIVIGVIGVIVFSLIYYNYSPSQVSTNSGSDTSSKLRKVEFYNSTDKKISLALAYKSLPNTWKSEGWYSIKPKSTYTHRFNSVSNDLFWYADGIYNGRAEYEGAWFNKFLTLPFCINKTVDFDIVKLTENRGLCIDNQILQNFIKLELTSQKNTSLYLSP